MCQNLVKSDHGVHDQLSLLCLWEKTSILFYSILLTDKIFVFSFFFLIHSPVEKVKETALTFCFL